MDDDDENSFHTALCAIPGLLTGGGSDSDLSLIEEHDPVRRVVLRLLE